MANFDLQDAVKAKVGSSDKKETKTEKATAPIKKRKSAPLMSTTDTTIKFTGLFDLSSEGVFVVGAGKKGRKTKGSNGTYCMQSIYFQSDEKEHLEELAEKYGCSASAIIRTLIANAQ